MSKIAVVTPAHNNKAHVLRFLESLEDQTYENLLIIIVDDGSTDGTAEAVNQDFPKTVVLIGDGNLWWSGATNLGVRHALKEGVDHIFTVNNDVKLAPNCLAKSVEFAEKHEKTLVGSMICDIDEPDEVIYFGGYFNSPIGDASHVVGKVSDFKEPVESEWLTGMGTLIPAQVFSQIGLFDDSNFPQYFGDADFALRAKEAGYSLWVTPEAVVLADLTSSWIGKNFFDQKIGFIFKAFYSRKSQFSLPVRFKFYRRHWQLKYLFRFYRYFFKNYVIPLTKHRFKRRIKLLMGLS